MKTLLLSLLCALVGFIAGVQYTYYQARQAKERIKAAIVNKVEDKYESAKKKLIDKFSKKDENKVSD